LAPNFNDSNDHKEESFTPNFNDLNRTELPQILFILAQPLQIAVKKNS
jgi:hypothetical protein